MFVVGDVEPGVEGLVRESSVVIARVGVGAVRVGDQAQAVVEERASAGVVLAVLGKATVHVRQPRADSILVALQRCQVDGVGEVRREELVGLGFQACPVRGQVRDFLVLARVAFVECRINVGCEPLVGGVADREGGVGVRDQALGDGDGHGPSCAVRFLRGAAGADEVGVGRPARIRGEIEQHA
ncbi:hypothetical protein [uncultured Microbacterium sp.]|uniref:hypothetical protein n=1 Tax=uncultured Microbacterium sp. TaxID=191216 RepID=UPI00260C5A35|nr:hypothetical protein [uncultured Microbacterium sp.]